MEKSSFPIKTKIAALWMVVFGILAIINLFRLFSPSPGGEFGRFFVDIFAIFLFSPILIVIAIVFLLNSVLLFLRRELGWWLSIITILPFGYFVLVFIWEITFYPLPFVIIPFILLLIDRKDFWKIAK